MDINDGTNSLNFNSCSEKSIDNSDQKNLVSTCNYGLLCKRVNKNEV